MKTFVAAAFAAGLLLATGAPAAHAADDFRGGCGWVGEADPTSTAWEGVMYVAVVATGSAPAFVTASCELIVNGSSFGTMLGPSSTRPGRRSRR